jgi:isoaspartyl peptidase/L-asparaginase-like protein (Ntn-hydrolase superfamily)
MDGADLAAGAVCAVRGICPVISVARLVLERTPHVMLAGDQARRFALENGFVAQNLATAESLREYAAWREGAFAERYVHTAAEAYRGHGDTVTMLACRAGHTVAASSTSGISWKIPGRVGDSPIVGAGIYADDEVGCAGATGLGEELWKACASFRAVEFMRSGLSPQEAADTVVRQMIRRQPRATSMMCVVMALSRDGDFGASTTTGEFPMWIAQGGSKELRLYGAPA